MDDILTRHGFRVAVMKADAVAPNKRENWVADRVKQGIDVMICHPRLVQTGLDLIDFQTLCWYETDYSVYVMRQASRRSWRIGQTRPVKVVFMSYRNTLQADALKLVAKKLQSSLAVEGELPEDGLAAFGDDGDDMMMALARKIVSGEEDDDENETVEDGLRPGADRRGHRRGTAGGRRLEDCQGRAGDGFGQRQRSPRQRQRSPTTLFGIGPTVELVVGGQRPRRQRARPRACPGQRQWQRSPRGGRRSRSSRCSPGPSSWPSRSSRRVARGKRQPASLSMFEWALEQEREKEPVGAGR